jgi:O-antigen/teichoic acid export membrane protein
MSVIDQKRIAKNTLLLYIRMGLIMLISLYTSRVILDALGETDMGIYSTVGGIVMMFAFLSNTMSTACQRFFAYELGRNDFDELKRVFSISVLVFVAIAIIVVVLCETAGLALLYKKIQTEGRFEAALWVFQCSILSFVFTILRTPYQGMIIIKEKMKVFTYISVVEAVGNLAIALLIARTSSDRLILYGVLMLVINVLVSLYYILYCTRFYNECRFRFYWDTAKFKEIFSFAGWNMIGSLSGVCKSQGLTILLNIFFGNAIVAARTMSYKVYVTIQQFADNFLNAIRPQIMKSYAADDKEGMNKLINQGSKFSYFLLFIVALPILTETSFILNIWLKEVPNKTAIFSKLVIINALIDVLSNPIASAIQAQGNIKWYQIVCGSVLLLILPFSYLCLKLGYAPESVFIVSIIISLLIFVLRLMFAHKMLGVSYNAYLKNVVVPISLVTILSPILPIVLHCTINVGWKQSLFVIIVSVLCVTLFTYILGLTRNERKLIMQVLNSKLHMTK